MTDLQIGKIKITENPVVIHNTFSIGKYIIEYCTDTWGCEIKSDTILIRNKDGEAGDFSVKKLEKLLDRFFKKEL